MVAERADVPISMRCVVSGDVWQFFAEETADEAIDIVVQPRPAVGL